MIEPSAEDLHSLDPETALAKVRDNPLWQEAVARVQASPAVRIFYHIGRLHEALLFLGEMIQIQAQARPALIRAKTRGPAKLIEDNPDLLIPTDPQTRESAKRLWLRVLEHDAGKRVDEYPQWTLNQGLVILCTRFDVFLEETVDAIYRQQVKLLYGSAAAQSIVLKAVVEAGSTEAVLKEVRETEARAFSFESITKRFKYLRDRLHLDTARVFNWSLFTGETVKQKFAGWDLRKLHSIFDLRHRIVHRDELPAGTLQELAAFQEFFEKIMISLGILARDKHGVELDAEQSAKLAYVYDELRKGKAAQSPGGD